MLSTFEDDTQGAVDECEDAEHQQDWSSWANSARHDRWDNNMGDMQQCDVLRIGTHWQGTRLMQQTMVHWMLATGRSYLLEAVTTSYDFKLKLKFFSVWSPRSRFPGFGSSVFFDSD